VADAHLPAPHPSLIVPGRSIGAVSLGMAFTQAEAAWGGVADEDPNACLIANGVGSCRFTANLHGTTGIASFSCKHGRIDSILIRGPFNQGTLHYDATGPLTAFHTSKGIHIGSTVKAVKHAYPKGKIPPLGGGLSLGSGARETAFAFDRGKVVGISIGPA
jgi:hypothetical protein